MSDGADNPLIGIPFTVPFDRIRAEHVEPAVDELIAGAQAGIDNLAELPEARTFENTMSVLDSVTEPLDRAMTIVAHLEAVATYPEFRDAFNSVQPKASAFEAGIRLHAGLWKALRDYAKTPEAEGLRGARRRYLERELREFRRHGAELKEDGKARLRELDVELAKLTTSFSQNALDATNAFELYIEAEDKLAGLPQSARDLAAESAKSKGKSGWRFTLQAPSYVAVMTYLDDASIREQVYRAYNSRAAGGELGNAKLIARVLELRREKATLLGYRDYSDFVLEERMAKSGVNAQQFLAELQQKTAPHFERENRELQAFRMELEGAGAPALQPWDLGYYAEKLRQARFDFNEEDLRPYFALENVVNGLFELVHRLFGVRVVEENGVPVWDEGTRYYSLVDGDGRKLGAFYADWFPRENKRGGAWMNNLITGRETAEGFEPHLGLVCGNLNPPSGGRPALLTHNDVETIFHEFGHLLHHLFTRVPIRSLAGVNVAWDFVELPSQMMQNWCWERESLALFARHWETAEPIPDELFAKMKRARTFRAANAQMRQLGLGWLDLALHREYDPRIHGDIQGYARRIAAEFAPAPLPDDYSMITAFSHLFASPVGYAAGYYSYKWAEVLDADAFTRFLKEGIFSREVGRGFREKILAKGDSEDPVELYRSFMGRDPDVTALLARAGLQ